MAEKDSNPKQWSDPKDFGLPYVEVIPLSSVKSNSKATDQAPSFESPKTSPITDNDKKQETKTSRLADASITPTKNEKKKVKTWVWVVVFAIVAAVTVIIVQLNSNQKSVSEKANLVGNPLTTTSSKLLLDSVKLTNSNLDSLPNQDSSIISDIELTSTSTNSGTSIATNSKVKRVEQKVGNTRYYLVVGSFASEEESARYIQNLGDKFSEYYLVHPFKQNQNYRLAIGSYSTWKEASVKLKEMNAQDSTDYWILNY